MRVTEERKVVIETTPVELARFLWEQLAKTHSTSVDKVEFDEEGGKIYMFGKRTDTPTPYSGPMPSSVAKMVYDVNRATPKKKEYSFKGMTEFLEDELKPETQIPIDKLFERAAGRFGRCTLKAFKNGVLVVGKSRNITEIHPNIIGRG